MKSQRNYFVRNASALLGASPLLLNTMRTGAISALLACVGPFELFARSDGLFVVVGLSNGTLRWLDCWLAGWQVARLRSCNCLCHFFDGPLLTCRRFSRFSRRREATLARPVN